MSFSGYILISPTRGEMKCTQLFLVHLNQYTKYMKTNFLFKRIKIHQKHHQIAINHILITTACISMAWTRENNWNHQLFTCSTHTNIKFKTTEVNVKLRWKVALNGNLLHKTRPFHVNSPKILVGGSFPFIGGPENEKKIFWKILNFF